MSGKIILPDKKMEGTAMGLSNQKRKVIKIIGTDNIKNWEAKMFLEFLDVRQDHSKEGEDYKQGSKVRGKTGQQLRASLGLESWIHTTLSSLYYLQFPHLLNEVTVTPTPYGGGGLVRIK